jgi:nucleotide-binding universal stress UspA family protein
MIIKENQTILIPVDFSKQSYIAVKQSYGLAKHTKSKLLIMHVQGPADPDRSEDLQKLVESTHEESGLLVDSNYEKGELYELVNKKAEELECSLIIFAIDDNAKFKTGFLGRGPSVSKFVRQAPCPVITLRSGENKDAVKNIVMPFDLTPESREKVSFAVQLAHYFAADIRIVSVFKPNDDEYENRLLPYLKQVKKFIKQEGVNCTNRSLPSNKPAEAIVEYAVKNSGDLIIQISRRDLSFLEMLNGTIDQKIVELSPIPVLNVHPMKRDNNMSFSSGI